MIVPRPRGPRLGPGPGSVAIEIYAPPAASGRWDRASWDGAPWGSPTWQRVDCETTEAVYRYGVTDEAGVLSSPDSGPCDLDTFDPDRTLDPSNPDSPFFGYVGPGTPIRVRKIGATSSPAWAGYIDEASYDVKSGRGRIRCVDGIAYLAQADIPVGTVLPNTLRARVRAVVAAVGLTGVVPVEPDPPGPSAYLPAVLADGAVAYWRLGDAVGTLPVDSVSGASNVTAVVGTAPTLGVAGALTGDADKAATFGGAGSWTVPSSATLNRGDVVTVEAWVYPGVPGAARGIVSRGVGGYYLRLDDTNRLNFLRSGVADIVHSVDPVPEGGWHHVAATKNGATVRLYVDGVDVTGTVSNSTLVNPTSALAIGSDNVGTGDRFNGSLDEVAIYPTALAAATILAHYTTGRTSPPSETPDASVAPYDSTRESTAWAVILDAAQDALFYVWLGPAGTLRFTSWGAFPDADISIGCGPVAEGPWVETIETVGYTAAASGIRNQVRAWSAPNVQTAIRADAGSVNRYGARLFAADRVVPSFATWADRILADRAGAGLAVDLGTVRPLTEIELDRLLLIGTTGPCIVRVRDDSHPPTIDQDVSVIGALVRVTEVGWSFEFATAIPRVEWESVDPTPPEPPIPPPDPWHVETRTYIATSDALLALTSGGSQYGAGASSTLPVGAYQGWTYRGLVQFPSIPWTKVRAIRTATLKLRTTDQVRVAFGSGPTIEVRRITGAWSAGSSSSPSGGNAVVYPGPSTTSTGAVRSNVTGSQNADVAIRVDAIARAWSPASVGGSAAAQRGVALYPGSGSTSDTTEFWPVEKGGASRPVLELVVEVFD